MNGCIIPAFYKVFSGASGIILCMTHVHFLSHVSYEALPRWYNACNVFAMPNRDIDGDTEGFGLEFLEVAASGKPAIAGKAGGTGSAVVDGETGLRVIMVKKWKRC